MNTKMTFRRNIKNQNRRGLSTPRKFLAIGLAVFFLLALVLQDFSFKFAIRPFFYAMEPLLETKKDLKNWWEGKRAGFAEKKNILAENRALTEKAAEMKISLSLLEIFEKENAELKAAFSAEERKNYIFGSVISRPPFTPYDLLIIDAGAKDGVEEGMQVLAFGKVLLSYVADVFPDKRKTFRIVVVLPEHIHRRASFLIINQHQDFIKGDQPVILIGQQVFVAQAHIFFARE